MNDDNRGGLSIEHLSSLALVAAIGRYGSMSGAAREAGLTRSAVSQRLRRLEDELGVVLFRRTTRRLEPTEAGAVLLAASDGLLDELARIDASWTDRAPAPSLHVEVPRVLVGRGVAAALAEFSLRSPGPVHLEVADARADLLRTRADVVVRVSEEVPEDAVARRLFIDRTVVVGSPDYLARRGAPAQPFELTRHSCLRYVHRELRREWRFRVDGRTLSVPVRSSMRSDDAEALVGWALEGRGLVSMPSFMVAHAIAEGTLVEVLADAAAEERPTAWAILPAGRGASRRARALLKVLARTLAKVPRA